LENKVFDIIDVRCNHDVHLYYSYSVILKTVHKNDTPSCVTSLYKGNRILSQNYF